MRGILYASWLRGYVAWVARVDGGLPSARRRACSVVDRAAETSRGTAANWPRDPDLACIYLGEMAAMAPCIVNLTLISCSAASASLSRGKKGKASVLKVPITPAAAVQTIGDS